MKILILGASGMIGSTIARVLHQTNTLNLTATGRRESPSFLRRCYSRHDDLLKQGSLSSMFEKFNPQIVINCAGLTKHTHEGNCPLSAISMNALFPHMLVAEADKWACRVVHISTDCVFDGTKGNYSECDISDAEDLYGRTKSLAEYLGGQHITIRTSTIGPEFGSKRGLLEWFLDQRESCHGYTNAYFSGLPTVELARFLRDHIIHNDRISGLFNVGGEKISKYDLLMLTKDIFDHNIEIKTSDRVTVDRTLNSAKIKNTTGYVAPTWPDLIEATYKDWVEVKSYVYK